MNNKILLNLLTISNKQKLIALILGLAWLIIAAIFQVSQQYNQQKTAFEKSMLLFQNQKLVEHKREETILNALSEYYTSQTIKSYSDFRNFAQGLIDNKHNHYTLGIADLVSRQNLSLVESSMHSLGYESFKISNSQLFKEQVENSSLSFLAVTMVSPLDPKRSIYLSEDLFTLPDIVNTFNDSIKSNKPKTLLLTNAKTGELYKLVYKPIFLDVPSKINFEQRMKQVRGAVFILYPYENAIINNVAEFLNLEDTTININKNDITHLVHLHTSSSTFNKWIERVSDIQFSQTISLPTVANNDSIRITQSWNLSDINIPSLVLVVLLNAIVFFILASLLLTLARYMQNLRVTKRRLNQIIETSQDAVIITDKEGFIIDWNPEAEKLFKHSKAEALGQCIIQLIFKMDIPDTDQSQTVKQQNIERFYKMLQLSTDTLSKKIEVTLKDREQKPITAEVATSILNIREATEISLFIKDITYQRATENAITQMAYFDALTGLENRTFFKSSVDQIIEADPDSKFALVFLDLDGFKQVNDTLGHNIGDELLKVIAKRIQGSLRQKQAGSHICRFGGDEFVILIPITDEKSSAQISLRILNQIERTIKIDEDELQVSASIGIAQYPEHGQDVDTLLRRADTAMYQSKALGKNTYSHYNDSMEESIAERSLIEKHLRKAISFDEFTLVYQPQIEIQTGLIIGVEALIRWNNPVLGFVPPDKFIPIAEDSNLILSIGEWVTKACIAQLEAWKNTEFSGLHIAMNVSSVQFESPYFLGYVRKLMELSDIPNHLLEIELTERTVMNNVTENINRFNNIRSSGFGLSVDDFGTGYSSLSYLKKFPLSILKIDKSFIDGIPQDEEDIIITTAILNLAHSLSMKVVAEGVETEEQLKFLQNLKCNIAQGYYISRPLSTADFEAWLTENKSNFFYNLPQFTIENQDA